MKSINFIVSTICTVIFCLWLFSCKPQTAKPVILLVSSATTYQEVLLELGKLYQQEKPNITINYNFGPSIFLKEQIKKGVPVDIFFSVSNTTMDDLQSLGLLIAETRQNLPLTNQLVLIVPQDSTLQISNFKDLINEKIKRVALGQEKLLAGINAKETLTSLGIYDRVKNKGIFAGDDIRQILKAVETKKVDAGITYLTEAKLSDRVKVVAIAPENTHSPIVYNVAVIKGCQNVPEAKEFIQFIKSEKGEAISEKYGFTIIKQSS
ncbi:molybdate ABC transporter substrate-binding protein [Argonema galeatum]|uniref:molybdate ABC transporter substrate-binding protein n=1 Tax=Argonema galeatum TaxID=2942762 RepID=UPI00201273D9|nr:molybdate ABC transporter substrate-binding protein [Argonema galeatum]MCL1468867.1 molybdate ABC transporter substrate-binding protein [Argonema galeatum A003/A1]